VLTFWGCMCDSILNGRQCACFLDSVLSLKAVGGAGKEQKLSSNSELLVSFVCGRDRNFANFGNGQWRTVGEEFGVKPPPLPNFRRPSKIVPNSTRL